VQSLSFQPHLPEALTQIMSRALELDPAERYPNASALAFELRRVALGLGAGDGRLFLRSALDHELGDDTCEVTAERDYGTPPPLPRWPVPVQPDDMHELEDLPSVAHFGDADLG
jgi:hypothetical protein